MKKAKRAEESKQLLRACRRMAQADSLTRKVISNQAINVDEDSA